MAGNFRVAQKEQIDERILGLLGLGEEFELSYEEYVRNLKEALATVSLGKSRFSTEEAMLLQEEFRRVKSKKKEDRFRPQKKKITSQSFGVGKKLLSPGKVSKKTLFLPPTKSLADVSGEDQSSSLSRIDKLLESILGSLTLQNKEDKKRRDEERKKEENKRRASKEKKLETRPFEGIKKAVDLVTKPFRSLFDIISNFLFNVILGRIVIKLLDWFADPNNQGKIQSIIRFFKDHWPTLLALYLRFGTGLGRFIGKLGGVLIKGAFKLGALAAKLAAKVGLKGAGRLGKFLGGKKGRAIATGLGIASDVAVTAGAAAGISGLASGDLKVPGFSGGGWSGGIKNFFGNMFSGLVKGPKGRDKVPAMLTDGEFVMSAGAVQKYGVDTLESMNAAGGGTNIPQIADGMTFAEGGGYIGESFTQSSRSAAGLDDLAKRFDMDARTSPRYGENLPRLGRQKPTIKTIPTSRMLPAAGESSANAMRAASRTAQNVRSPIPASRAIVPYTGAGLSVPQIRTNMRVPGGFGNMKSFGAELLLSYLMQSGLDYIEAKRLSSSIEKARKESPEKLANRIEKLRELVNKEERFQKSFGGILQKVINLGGETGSETLSRQAKTILSGLGAKTFQGGAIKGGYGLKSQAFKDMPKTQIMTDDKGRPFVGYKAMKGGKPVYVRGPQPGTGTTNPLEMIGRMINPGAYKQSDAMAAQRKYQEASAGSIASLKARGASQATIARRQAELKKGVKPLPKAKPKPKYNPAGGGMGGGRGSKGSSAKTVPSFKANHGKTNTAKKTLGINR